MKYSKKIRGMSTALAFAFTFMVFSFSFAPKAYAAEAEATVDYGYYGQYSSYSSFSKIDYTSWQYNSATTPVLNGSKDFSSAWRSYIRLDARCSFNSDQTFSGPVKLYMSYYPIVPSDKGSVREHGDDFYGLDTWSVIYVNDYGQTAEVVGGLDSFISFTANTAYGKGYALEASWVGSELHPITGMSVRRTDFNNCLQINSSTSTGLSMYFPSVRVIATAYSAEMEALDNVANEIAAQSDILLAMKGDIVAILQDIYTMTGDMHIAQNLLNSYIAQMLPLLESIDQTTTNIYALLSSQLAALETAIETAASSVEAAIEAQTAAMIAYLEEMFNTGNEVPDETYQQQQDAENILDQMESLEKPDVETIVPEIDDYSDGGVSGVMSAIFSSNLIVTMMTLSASLAFGAYVLFGKRS